MQSRATQWFQRTPSSGPACSAPDGVVAVRFGKVPPVGDIYEVVLTMDIRADVTDDELAELRWHVGQGSRPERLPIRGDNYLATFPLGDPHDPDCEWETAEPEPAFPQRGAAWNVGGALVAELVRREESDGWSLTVRQEFHPDDFYQLRTLLDWLGRCSVNAQISDIAFFVGYMRFYENAEIAPLVLLNGRIRVPEDIESHTPHWQGT